MNYMKKNYKKFLLIFLATAALMAVTQVSSVIIIESLQLDRNQKFVAENYEDRNGSDTLVIYFSRSGNTELMAMEIAKAKRAKTLQPRC